MRRYISRVPVLLSALAVVTALLLTRTPTVDASSAPVITKFPVSGAVFANLCGGSDITLTSGFFQIVEHVTATPNGGVHFIVEGNASAVRGVDGSGTEYVGVGGFWVEGNLNPNNAQENFTAIDIIRFTSRGAGTGFLGTTVVHVTLNADGTLTVFLDSFTLKCNG